MADEIKPQFSEDQELERAKAWWKENGRSIVAGVVIGLSAVVGFNFWQSYQQTQAEEASFLFEQLRAGAETTEAESDISIETVANDLMTNYTSTPYAVHAALVLARSSVESSDLETAEQHLRWVLENSDDDGWLHVARLRLASVLLSKGETDSVLTLLKVDDRAGFTARYSELTGDTYRQSGDIEGARSAYINSLDSLPPGSANLSLLKLKLDSLGK